MINDEPGPNAPRLSDPAPRGDEQSNPLKLGIFAIIAVALLDGLILFSRGDNSNTTASNSAPGVTTGSTSANSGEKAPASR
jgi:hypothetical protein